MARMNAADCEAHHTLMASVPEYALPLYCDCKPRCGAVDPEDWDACGSCQDCNSED